MNPSKQARLEAAGFRVGTVEEFLADCITTEEDRAWIIAFREFEAGTDNHNTCPCGMDAHNDTLCEDCREER